MKKYFILTALSIFMQAALCIALPVAIIASSPQKDSLAAYTGKYESKQGMQTVYADVYVENGKVIAKSSVGDVLTLDHLSGDNFVIDTKNIAVKFIRDKDNKVSQIAVMGNIAWTKVGSKAQTTGDVLPFTAADYLGKYQIIANGQTLYLEISLKNSQLWATQLWDGGNSGLDYVSADKFIVNALSIPIKFLRDKDRKINQLLLNGTDLFTRIKN